MNDLPKAPGKVLGRGLKDLTSTALRAPTLLEPLFAPPKHEFLPLPRVLVVSSGKGGTGKSFISANLACGLAALDQRVLLIDADFGLANAHLLLGLNPRHDISHLVTGKLPIRQVLQDGPCNLKLLGGCSGISELSALSYEQFCLFISEGLTIESEFDWIIVDTSAGISPQVMSFLSAGQEVLLVVNPEATSMLDAYATLKTLYLRNPGVEVGFIANRVKDSIVAKDVYKKVNGAVEHYLKRSLAETGFVVLDAAVGQSITHRRPLLLDEPTSPAAFCLKKIVQKILESKPKGRENSPRSYFASLQKEVKKRYLVPKDRTRSHDTISGSLLVPGTSF